MPIHEITEGQEVYAADESCDPAGMAAADVGVTIDAFEATLLHLTVVHEVGSVETIHTTDGHPFHAAHTGEWTRADHLRPGDLLTTMAGVAQVGSITFGQTRVPVYNLSIPGSPTYFVGDRGLWVHYCGGGAHYLTPIFLRGIPRSAAGAGDVLLDSTKHSHLHKLINAAGAKRGIPKHSGPGNGAKGVTRWANKAGPDQAEQLIRESLIEAYSDFDNIYGTNLFAYM